MMNDALMVIGDLSGVWGEADIFEADIPMFSIGMPAEITLRSGREKRSGENHPSIRRFPSRHAR